MTVFRHDLSVCLNLFLKSDAMTGLTLHIFRGLSVKPKETKHRHGICIATANRIRYRDPEHSKG
jgi:hypothetical protein